MEKNKGLSVLHLVMMTLGTAIGGSFFLGSAVAVHAAGPAVLISFVFGGILVYFILFSLSEMTVSNPDTGSFRTYAAQAFGDGAGFVVGWVYWSGMVLAMSSEATAVSILLTHWLKMPIPILGSIVIAAVTVLNLLGAEKLSKLESGLASIKLFAIGSFIILAVLLIIGLFPHAPTLGLGETLREPFMPGGIKGIAGSMLIVMFTYAGFEIIGLFAPEAEDPQRNIPKAIKYTVISLVALYMLSITALLPLLPTEYFNESASPMVLALDRWGISWAGFAINFVLITAILSTMLAAMFGLGRMMRSLVDEGHAPKFLQDKKEVPYRGILVSGLGMLAALGVGLLFPKVYLFLISSGGFALLFTYAVIIASHIRFRKKHGCPQGKCQMPGFPYTSWFALISMLAIMASMPFIKGQGAGLLAGLAMILIFIIVYCFLRRSSRRKA